MKPIFTILSFTLFLILPVEGKATQCDPELEKECIAKICNVKSSGIIPLEDETLDKEIENFSYEMPADLKEVTSKLEGFTKEAKTNLNKLVSDPGIPAITDEILKDPIKSMEHLRVIFANEMKFRDVAGQVVVKYSDMEDILSQDFKKFISEYQGLANPLLYSGFDSDLKGTHLRRMKLELVRFNGKNYNHIQSIKDEPFATDYAQFITQKLTPFKGAISAVLKKKIQKNLDDNFLSSDRKQAYERSCKGASYVHQKLSTISKEQLDLMVEKVINDFKQNLLSKLSKSSAEALSTLITKDKIHLIEEENHPRPKTSDFESEFKYGYIPFRKLAGITNDISILENSKKLACQSSSLFTTDHYFGRSVHISKMTIAMGQEEIIAHELGHYLSHIMSMQTLSAHSKEKLIKLRKCIQGFYPHSTERSTAPWTFPGDKSRTEEDFADYISSLVIPKGKGFGCEMRSLIQVYFKDQKGSSYDPVTNDEHSNNLFRELHMKLNRGETLPQSCVNLMNNTTTRPVKCEF